MRFLITGVTGFAGTHLAGYLLTQGHEVIGTTRGANVSRAGARRFALERVQLIVADVCDRAGVAAVIGSIRPNGVFHLAGLSSVATSFADPEQTYRANLLGALNVFAAVHGADHDCRVVWIGSSDAYGHVEADELPVSEVNPFRPLSPYGVSKAAADLAAYQWAQAEDLDVVRLRPFGHVGPGQAPQFMCSDFARQVVEVGRGRRPPRIDVGNLDVVRDFTDVRDIVRAYFLAWQKGRRGEAYNVCSGVPRTPGQVLESLIRLAGVQADPVLRPDRQRPVDVETLVGSAAKLERETGWTPEISWEQTLRDVLEDWRQRS